MARLQKEKAISAGLLTGALASIVASLVSLPLKSPHDGLFNTFSVTIGCILLGIVSGVVWRITQTQGSKKRLQLFIASIVVMFIASLALGIVMEIQLERSISFIVVLAAIALSIVGIGLPYLSRYTVFIDRYLQILIVSYIVALSLGIGLYTVGDAQVTQLELP